MGGGVLRLSLRVLGFDGRDGWRERQQLRPPRSRLRVRTHPWDAIWDWNVACTPDTGSLVETGAASCVVRSPLDDGSVQTRSWQITCVPTAVFQSTVRRSICSTCDRRPCEICCARWIARRVDDDV